MGADIHAHAEYRDPHGVWHAWQVARRRFSIGGEILEESLELDIGRNYLLFAGLAGVRAYHSHGLPMIAEPRGLPNDCSAAVTRALARSRREYAVHDTSYVTLAEVEALDWEPIIGSEPERHPDPVRVMLARLLEPRAALLEDRLDTLRLVFWFDN